ncbi:MAG TPA: hypothetical protein VJY83_01025, partial [Thiopseudomonas sp.]|nr:hypothetical protein [Thiopseudomonas sp.]
GDCQCNNTQPVGCITHDAPKSKLCPLKLLRFEYLASRVWLLPEFWPRLNHQIKTASGQISE